MPETTQTLDEEQTQTFTLPKNISLAPRAEAFGFEISAHEDDPQAVVIFNPATGHPVAAFLGIQREDQASAWLDGYWKGWRRVVKTGPPPADLEKQMTLFS